MGKRSVRENKSIWQKAREEAGLTRAEAAEAMQFVSESRIEKYESGRSPVQPEEILAMSKAYRRPDLCNYYCSHECPIGKEYVPSIEVKDLAAIVLKMLADMNSLEEKKNKLIQITADGKITDHELLDFARIEKGIRDISMSADALHLWVDQMTASDRIDEEKLKEARKAVREQ